MFKKLYLRIRYWRQLRKGFKLLPSNAKRNFVLANDRIFIMNGVDPLVRVDLSTNKAESYVDKDFVWPASGIHGVGVYKVGTDPKKVNGHIDV